MNWSHHFQEVSASPSAPTARFGGLSDVDPETGQTKIQGIAVWTAATAGLVLVGGAMYFLGETLERYRHEDHHARQIAHAKRRRTEKGEDRERALREKALRQALLRVPSTPEQELDSREMKKTVRAA